MSNDREHGFLLNGKPINLHGANRRQDYGFLGDAVPEAVGERDIRIIKDLGANFIRTSHYPQDPAVLSACDRLGILVWEEVPNIKIYLYPPSGDRTKPTETERFPHAYIENVKQQIREMIDRDRNHPSIIIWGFADDLSLYHYPEDFTDLTQLHALARQHSLDRRARAAERHRHRGCNRHSRTLQVPLGAPGRKIHLERVGRICLGTQQRRSSVLCEAAR